MTGSHSGKRAVLNDVSSRWLQVKRDVSQGLVLCPVLFMKYVNDIYEAIPCKITRFANNTVIVGDVTMTRDTETLQSDLDQLICWVNDWQMEFNVDKCKVSHSGRQNDCVHYLMNRQLSVIKMGKDLSIIISND